MIPIPLVATLAVLAANPADVLLVERKEDKRGRNAAYAKLRSVTVDFHPENQKISDVAKWLSFASDGVNFLYLGDDKGTPAEPVLTMDLDRLRLTQIMSLIHDVTGLAFVYRAGVVMIKPQDQVREETELRIYDLRAATAPLVSFVAPELGGLYPSGYEPDDPEEPEYSDTTISGFTVDDVEPLVRENAGLDNWDREGVSMMVVGGLLVVRQTERGHARVRATLRALGVW